MTMTITLMTNALEYLKNTAARLPNKIAFSDEKKSLTFSELNIMGKNLGGYIAANTVGHNRPIAVFSDRSVMTLAIFIGVLYSGNYYVPIDAEMPPERIRVCLEHLNPLAVLSADDNIEFTSLSCEEGFCFTGDIKNTVLDIDPAYVLFTSGSTGEPKGIVISHRSVIDCIEWESSEFDFAENDILASQVPFYFDPFIKDFFLTLKCGMTAYILPKRLFMFPLRLMEFIRDKKATVLLWSTSAFNLVANSGALIKCAPTALHTVVFGGEQLFAKQLTAWQNSLPNVRYINFYGPTEVTVECAYHIIDRRYGDNEAVPIGIPCGNKEILLLDENLLPVLPGQPGEICVRGIGLSLGYYGDREKTAAAFVQNPGNPWYRDTIYRTGDLGVYNEEGLLMFVSRMDDQIKHMGYRIELGDVEIALLGIDKIQEAVCFYANEKIYTVYAGDIRPGEILKVLEKILPKYMRPGVLIRKDTLPKNATGKIDRIKLKEDALSDKNL